MTCESELVIAVFFLVLCPSDPKAGSPSPGSTCVYGLFTQTHAETKCNTRVDTYADVCASVQYTSVYTPAVLLNSLTDICAVARLFACLPACFLLLCLFVRSLVGVSTC